MADRVEKGPLVTEEEFRNFMYEMASHSPAARAITDRWWSEELTRSGDIEDAARAEAEAAAAAKAAEVPPPKPATFPGAGWQGYQPGGAA